jgi:beta-N-acetylhexosaminidase
MMLGHQQVPGLTGIDRPASLSPAAYRLLREGHGYGAPPFDGAIFTDDLSGMRAVTNDFPLPRAVTESLIAGADSPLWITTAGIPEALDSVERAIAEGALTRNDLHRSLARMAALRGIPGCLSWPATGQVAQAGSLAAPVPDLPHRGAPPGLPVLPG